MTEPRIQLLDDLGAEFARVAAEHERSTRRSQLRTFVATPRHALAVAVASVVLLAGGAYAVPPTRAAIDDIASSFAGWVADDDEDAPGRALRPEDEAPDWVSEGGGRVIAETAGVKLYVTRVGTEERGTLLSFSLGNGAGLSGNIEDWRERFQEHAVVVLGPAPFGPQDFIDEQGQFPLMGVTARSVKRVELHYSEGPPDSAAGIAGGFVLIADASRPLRQLGAYDAAGRELERVDVSHLDMRYLCKREPGCPSSDSLRP
jgi:hypothetical protein